MPLKLNKTKTVADNGLASKSSPRMPGTHCAAFCVLIPHGCPDHNVGPGIGLESPTCVCASAETSLQ